MGLLDFALRPRKQEPQTPSTPKAVFAIPPDRSLLHITHAKAASQWFRCIFRAAFGSAIVEPDPDGLVWFQQGITPGKVYPCVFLSSLELAAAQLHGNIRRCVVIRDLRDTAVSAYFSLLATHRLETPMLVRWRMTLKGLSNEEGLMLIIERFLSQIAVIQRSWVESEEQVLHVEDFFTRPLEMFQLMFRRHFDLEIERPAVEALLARNNFERYSGGRKTGEEDRNSHFRKGVAGDWRSHFTQDHVNRFKQLYGPLLILTGYEENDRWG